MTFRTGICPKGYIDIKAVAKMLGIGVTSAWALVKERPDFPKKVKFGARRTRWNETEVAVWLDREVETAISGTEMMSGGA